MGNPIGPSDSNKVPARPGNTTPKQTNKQDGDGGQRNGTNVQGNNNSIVNNNIIINAIPSTVSRTTVSVRSSEDALIRSVETPCIEVPRRQYKPANANDQAVIKAEENVRTCPKMQARLTGDHPCGYEGIKRMDASRQAWRAQNSGKTFGVDKQDKLLAKAEAAAAKPSGKTVQAPPGLGQADTEKLQGLRNVFHEFWNNDGKCIKFIDMQNEIPAIAAYAKAHGISTEDVGRVFMQSVKEDTPFSMDLMARQWAQIAGSSAFKGNNSSGFTTFFNDFGTQIANGVIDQRGLKPGQVVASFEGKSENASFDNVLITVGSNGRANIQGLSTNADALNMPGRIFYDFDGNTSGTTSSDVSSSTTTGSPNGAFGDNGTVPVPGTSPPKSNTEADKIKKDLEALKSKVLKENAKEASPILESIGTPDLKSMDTAALGSLIDRLTDLLSIKGLSPGLVAEIRAMINRIRVFMGVAPDSSSSTPADGSAPANASSSTSTSKKVDVAQLKKDLAAYASNDDVGNINLPNISNLETASPADIEKVLNAVKGSDVEKIPSLARVKASLIERLNALIQEKKVATKTAPPPLTPGGSTVKPESKQGQAILDGLKDIVNNPQILSATAVGNVGEIRGLLANVESIDKLDSKGLTQLLANLEKLKAELKDQKEENVSAATKKKIDDLAKLVKNKLTDNLLSSVKDLLFIGAQGTDKPGAPALSGFSSVGGLDSKGLEALKGEIEAFRNKGYTSPEQEKAIDNILLNLENLITEKKTQESIENKKSLESELNSLKDDEGFKLQLGESLRSSPLDGFSSLEGLTIPALQALKSNLASLKTADFVDNSTRAKIDSILGKLNTVIAEEKEKASKSTFQADTDHGLTQKFFDSAENGVKLLPPSVDDIKKDIGKAKGSFESSFGDTKSSVLNRWDDATKAKTLRFIAQYATNIAEAMKQSGAKPEEIQVYTDKANALNTEANKLEGTPPPPPGAFSP